MARAMKDSGIEWIGEIPEGWMVSKLQYFIDCYDGRRVPVDAAERTPGPYPYWGAGSIMDYVNDYLFDEELLLLGEDGAPFFDYTRPVAFYSNEKIWVNNHIHVLKPHADICIKYLLHYLNNVDYKSYINGSILNKLTQSNMNKIALLLPPVSEQQIIADYLDTECAKIDAVIEQTRASIEEYKKLKQSVITQAVTKGIRPGRKMKDSGVEWIGEIPEEWTLRKTKAIANRIVVGVVIKPADYFDDAGTVPFLRGINVKEYRVNSSPMVYISETTNEILSKSIVHAGDILVVRDGSIGVSAVVPEEYDGANVVSMIIVTCNDMVLPDYLCYSLNSDVGKTQFNLSKIGTALTHTSVQSVSNLLHLVPPIEEQIEIVNNLKSKVASFETLIQMKEKIIAELESYKKSLIFEYVTGKKEVI